MGFASAPQRFIIENNIVPRNGGGGNEKENAREFPGHLLLFFGAISSSWNTYANYFC